MSLNDLAKRAHDMAVDKGFYDPPATIVEQLALIHSEVSEALEAFRDRGLEHWYRPEDGKPEGLNAELADVVIRVLDVFGRLRVDVDAVVREKMDFNATRSHRHGGKRL